MPARSIAANIEEWVADEVQQQSFTDDLGFVVYPVDGLVMINGQQPQAQTHWRISVRIETGLIDMRRPVDHSAIEKPDPAEQKCETGSRC